MSGFVYFMEAKGLDMVKIGHTIAPERRVYEIQTGCPAPLALLAVIPGSPAMEAELHARFADARQNLEWFRLTPELRDYIGALPAYERPDNRKPVAGILGAWLRANRYSLRAFATLIGTNASALHGYCTGRSIPGREHMVAIYVATDGEVTPNDFYSLPELPSAAKAA